MEGKGNLIAALIFIVLILSVIFGTIYYLTRGFRHSITQGTKSPAPIQQRNTQTPKPQDTSNDTVTYQGEGFNLSYPKNWGLITCNNSKNFEFDPYNPGKKTISCDRAQKPTTFLVNSGLSCQGGEVVKIGNYSVRKTKQQYRDWQTNQWCLETSGKTFDITNRVSSSGAVGTGKDDFSSEIEKIISSISF